MASAAVTTPAPAAPLRRGLLLGSSLLLRRRLLGLTLAPTTAATERLLLLSLREAALAIATLVFSLHLQSSL